VAMDTLVRDHEGGMKGKFLTSRNCTKKKRKFNYIILGPGTEFPGTGETGPWQA